MQVTEQDHEVHYAITGVANIVNPRGGHENDIPEGSLKFYWNRLLGMAGRLKCYNLLMNSMKLVIP